MHHTSKGDVIGVIPDRYQVVSAIRRRGFRGRGVTTAVRDEAERRAYDWACLFPGGTVVAELRPASYCGPKSPGARGAFTLTLWATHITGGRGYTILFVERDGRS